MDADTKKNVIGAGILGGAFLFLALQKNFKYIPKLVPSAPDSTFFGLFAGRIGGKTGWGVDYVEYAISASVSEIQVIVEAAGFHLSKSGQFYDSLTDKDGDILINNSIAEMADGSLVYLFVLQDRTPYRQQITSFV